MLWLVISTYRSAVTYLTFAVKTVTSRLLFPAIGYQQLRDVVECLVVDARFLGEEV